MVQAIPGGQRGGGAGRVGGGEEERARRRWGGGAGREEVGRRRGLGGTYVPYNPTYNEHTQHVHNDLIGWK